MDVTFVPPTAGLFGFYTAKLNLSGTPVRIVNVHLTPFQIKRGGGIRDAMTALSTTEDKHAIEIDAIVDAIDCQRPTIVVGGVFVGVYLISWAYAVPRRMLWARVWPDLAQLLGLPFVVSCSHDATRRFAPIPHSQSLLHPPMLRSRVVRVRPAPDAIL